MNTSLDPLLDGPILLLIRGLPGSGKSFLAGALQAELGPERVALIDPDKIDSTSPEYRALSASLTADHVEAKFHPYRFLRAQAYSAISARQIIIWNQAFTNLDGFNKTVVNLKAYAEAQGVSLPVLVVEVAVSHETAKARIAERVAYGEHDVPEEVFSRFVNEYGSFANEGYQVVAVNGEAGVSVSVAAVLTALQKLPKS